MDDIAEQLTLRRAKGSNTWEIFHARFLEETEVKFTVVEAGGGVGIVAKSADAALVGRAIRQLETIVQAGGA